MHLLGFMLNNNIFESVTLNCIYSYMQFKFKGWGMVTNNIVMLSHPNWPYLLSLKSAVSGHFFMLVLTGLEITMVLTGSASMLVPFGSSHC